MDHGAGDGDIFHGSRPARFSTRSLEERSNGDIFQCLNLEFRQPLFGR
jgi:hypothetical protein